MSYIGRTLLTISLFCSYFLFTACKKDYICPAYQSYYLLDSAKREKHFSMFGEDSMPKALVQVKKTKYGIMDKMSYRKKESNFNTLPMTIIYPELADSAVLKQDSLELMISGDSITMLN